MIKEINGGVTAPKGFAAVGIAAGIKKGKKDMAMIYSEAPCQVAGTFTTNVVKAAPVKWDQSVVYGGQCVHAIVANSGVAIVKRRQRKQRNFLELSRSRCWWHRPA